jgi:hypothetical protein
MKDHFPGKPDFGVNQILLYYLKQQKHYRAVAAKQSKAQYVCSSCAKDEVAAKLAYLADEIRKLEETLDFRELDNPEI